MPSTLNISAAEFRELATDGNLQEILELMLDHPSLLPSYLHFSSLSRTLRRLEDMRRELEEDLDRVFEDMTRNNFDEAFAFFVARRRHDRNTPYARPTLRRVTPRRRQRSSSSSDTLVSIHAANSPSPDPNDIIIPQPLAHTYSQFRTMTVTPRWGSVSNPIDVDRFPTPPPIEHVDTPVPALGVLHRHSRRTPHLSCRHCGRTDHSSTDCRWFAIPRRHT